MFSPLGTLLSNHAQYLQEISATISTQYAVLIVRKTVNDCQLALNSDWNRTISPHIRLKLRQRRYVATEQSFLLSNRIRQSEEKGRRLFALKDLPEKTLIFAERVFE